ncbi:MAG: AAA family ATPase, partial [Chloroflexota bacterium]
MIKLHALHATKFKQLDDLRLTFPERGSVLIQGLNEAGKSTLFESIYFALFGKALATEDNAGRLEDLVHYQAPRAFVRLAFSTEQARFTVDRTLHRGKPNAAALEVAYTAGRTEVVTNLTAVNRRITEELGVDAEALLNSCFVEQKKLEKLEGMSSQQRRDTLLKLLNLDKLARLEAQYRTGPADDAELRQRQDRLVLAQAQRDLPLLEVELRTIEQRLEAIAAHKLLDEQVAQRAIALREGERQQGLAARAGRLRDELSRLGEMQRTRDGAKRVGEAATALLQEQRELKAPRQDLEALREKAAGLPELELEIARVNALVEQLEQLDRAEQAVVDARLRSAHLAEAAARWDADREQLAHNEQQLADAQQSAAAVASDLEAAD